MLIFNITKYLYLKIKVHLDPFSIETAKILAVGIFSLIPTLINLESINPFFSILLKSILIMSLFLTGSWVVGTGKEEWAWIKSRLKKSGP